MPKLFWFPMQFCKSYHRKKKEKQNILSLHILQPEYKITNEFEIMYMLVDLVRACILYKAVSYFTEIQTFFFITENQSWQIAL